MRARLAQVSAVITAAQARRIALAAQGLGGVRDRSVTMRHVQRELRRLGQFQIDSVNVCVRAHYMPLFSRVGAYDRGLLDRAANAAPRRAFEFWGHAACLIDVELEPALRWRAAANRERPWTMMRELLASKPEVVAKIGEQVAQRGPLTAREVEHEQDRLPGSWWNWSEAKSALEWLFFIGELTSAGRNSAFERRYDLPHRVLPPIVATAPTPSEEESRLILARRAAAALGVFTDKWLAEYFYTERKATSVALAELVRRGEVEPVAVRGWERPAYLWAAAARPRRVHGEALVAPFDPLVFDRDRLAQVFGVHYRIGLYTPKEQRVHGYYVYPFVMDEHFAARVDLKADRKAGQLVVKSAWLEAGAPPDETARRLSGELHRMAGWLGLSSLSIEQRGDLAESLAAVS